MGVSNDFSKKMEKPKSLSRYKDLFSYDAYCYVPRQSRDRKLEIVLLVVVFLVGAVVGRISAVAGRIGTIGVVVAGSVLRLIGAVLRILVLIVIVLRHFLFLLIQMVYDLSMS